MVSYIMQALIVYAAVFLHPASSLSHSSIHIGARSSAVFFTMLSRRYAHESCSYLQRSSGRGLNEQIYSHAQRRSVQLALSASQIEAELRLDDRFGRWRFLQNLLEEEIDADVMTLVLSTTLNGFLENRSANSDDTASPELTVELRECIKTVLHDASAPVLRDLLDGSYDDGVGESPATNILDQLERLLPDPVDNEDAFKGLWDTVIELNGRESVKINERDCTRQWTTRCLVARVLLYYDFLSAGI